MNHTIWLMARKGDTTTLEHLIGQGKSVNVKNAMCETPLHIAASFQQEAAARLLLDNGALVNCRNGLSLQTPLHLACENNDVKTVSLLLERGADPEMVDKLGDTPLSIVREHNYRIVESLIVASNEVIACKLRCGAYVLRRLETAHLERDCPQRFVKCRLGCGAELAMAQTHKHESTSCLEARIPCWKGCGVTMRRRQMVRHVKLECALGAKTKCRFGCSILRSEQHAHERAHLERRCIGWSAEELGFWMATMVYDKLAKKGEGGGAAAEAAVQEFDLLEGTGFTREQAEADVAEQARLQAVAEEAARLEEARAKVAAAAAAEDGDGKGAEAEGADAGDAAVGDVAMVLDNTGEHIPQASFIPRHHGVLPPLPDPQLLSGIDYTYNLQRYKVTGRALCLFAANRAPIDSMEWILQRLGVSGEHRRLLVPEWLARVKHDRSILDAEAASSLPVGIGNPSVFRLEGEVKLTKFTTYMAVRNKVKDTPGLKWELPKSYRFVSMHTNRQIPHKEEESTLAMVHGYMVVIQGYNPEDEPLPPHNFP